MSLLDREYYVPCLTPLVDFARKNGPIDFRMDVEAGTFSIGVEYQPKDAEDEGMRAACIQMPADQLDSLIDALRAIRSAYKADNDVTINHIQTL